MKICKQCHVMKPLTAFGKMKKMRDGHINFCKLCKSQYRMAWLKNRYAWINELKVRCGCLHCKTKENLHFHHLEPKDKFMEVGNMKRYYKSNYLIMTEIIKCSVLCNPCHQLLHKQQKDVL